MAKTLKKDNTYSKLKSVLKAITAIHGTAFLISRTGRSFKLWIALIAMVALLTIGFMFVVKETYNSDRIYITMDATCRVKQVPFPAVSICNLNLVSFKQSHKITNILKQYNRSEIEIEMFFKALPNLASVGKNSINASGFSVITSILRSHYFSIENLMSELHQTCEDMLLFCSFNRTVANCNDLFKLVKTYQGHCCVFNYAGIDDGSFEQTPDDVEYYEEYESENNNPKHLTVTSESGRDSGLKVIFNVEPNDYPSWSDVPYDGAIIMLSEPNDYPETTTLSYFAIPGKTVDLKVEPMIFRSHSNLRRIHKDKRACLFHDEVTLEHTDRYSFETCITECKMLNYLATCGCIPYKYPKEKSVRTCELEDMACLLNMTVYGQKLICKPSCHQECNDQRYKMSTHVMPFSLKQFYDIQIKDVNTSELSALNVYYGKSTCTCYKLSLLIDIELFIATYGNIFSLSFGGSLMTLFELAYLLILSAIHLRQNISFIFSK